jgi:hypothetical protein
MNQIPVACTLSGSAFRDRLARIKRVGANALLGAERHPDRAVLRFRSDPVVRAELRAIRDAEAECCSFLRLDLSEEPDATVLSISSSNPDGEFMVDELAGAFGLCPPAASAGGPDPLNQPSGSAAASSPAPRRRG